MSAFKSTKRPKPLKVGDGKDNELFIDTEGVGIIRLGFKSIGIGPRAAMKMARWLERYAKWSSLK